MRRERQVNVKYKSILDFMWIDEELYGESIDTRVLKGAGARITGHESEDLVGKHWQVTRGERSSESGKTK